MLLSLLIVALVSAGPLSWYFLQELQAYGLRKLEERLQSEARLVAAITDSIGIEDRKALSEALRKSALEVNSSLIVLDSTGDIVASSSDMDEASADYPQRPEVRVALEGQQGKRVAHAPDGRLELFKAIPIISNGDVASVSYVSARTFSIATLLRDYSATLALLSILFAIVTLLLAETLARWISGPLRKLEIGAEAFAAGDLGVRVRPEGPRETRAAGEAFNTMADQVGNIVAELLKEERRKSQFVSDVSHELKSPLTAIRGTAETLLENDITENDRQRFLTTIVRESKRLSRLAEDLLALQRIEGATGELPMRRVDLLDVAQGAIEGLAHNAAQRQVTISLAGSAPAVLGDPDRLQQVIANILDNAVRHTPIDGKVTVELGRDETHALVSISDEGPGIPDESLPYIFDRFYRAQTSRDRATGGAGLGLAIARSIITRHAGEITAANLESRGARFTFKLPSLKD